MDRRQVKTRKAILKAFNDLMDEKCVDKITVTEICEYADIGKSTFYTHYETKEHLITEICEDFLGHLKQNEKSELFPDLEQMLLHLLWHIYDDKGNILKLIKDENIICNIYFTKYSKEIFANYLKLKSDNKFNVEFALNHIVEGFVSAVRWHINNPQKLTVEILIKEFIYFNSALL